MAAPLQPMPAEFGKSYNEKQRASWARMQRNEAFLIARQLLAPDGKLACELCKLTPLLVGQTAAVTSSTSNTF